MSDEEKRELAIRKIANAVHRLNEAVIDGVQAGITIEIMRATKYETDAATGDMVVPIIHK